MSCYFPENQVIHFKTGKAFAIKEIIGSGASSVVYRAVNTANQTEHLLKEYHPNYISLTRRENGDLAVTDANDQKTFNDGLDRFIAGCELQRKFRDDPDLKNVTSNIQDVHQGYGTVFIDMTYFSGKSYEKIKEKSLRDLIRRIRALAQTIAHYHNKGYLHLDLKPENIFSIPETSEMIMLFDFDSVVAKRDLRNMDARLSYTLKWAAPELLGSNPFSEVNESTDLYSIGMIFFHKLTGRFPDRNQLSSGNYHFDTNSRLLKKTSKRVLSLLSNFFRNTLCEVKECRWQTAEEMISALDDLLDAVNRPQHSYKPILIAVLLLCVPLAVLAFHHLTPEADDQPDNKVGIHSQEILSSETSGYNDEVTENVIIEPSDLNPHSTTAAAEDPPEPTDSAEGTVGATAEATEEYIPPSSTDAGNHGTYTIDTIAYVSDSFRSLIVTNDGVVYYIDGSTISNSANSISIDMQTDFDVPLENGYLAYDPYNDIVYLLAGGSLSIYDISDLSSPSLVLNDNICPDIAQLELDPILPVAPQISILPDGSLLVPAYVDGTYRVDVLNKRIARFSYIHNLQSSYYGFENYYARVIGDCILELQANSREATVVPLSGGQKQSIQLEMEPPRWCEVWSTQDGILFFVDGLGVCQIYINGTASVMIPQENIKIRDFQSLDNNAIQSIAANQNGIIAFYDYTLRCIRCISTEE